MMVIRLIKTRYLITFLLFGLLLSAADNVGSRLSAFDLPLLEDQGKIISSKSYQQGVLLINFWAAWCLNCKKEMPLLESLAKKYQKSSFKVIAVDLDRKRAYPLEFAQKLKDEVGNDLAMLMVYDEEKSLFKKHPSQGYPYSLLVKDGVIIEDYLGSFDRQSISELDAKIGKLLH